VRIGFACGALIVLPMWTGFILLSRAGERAGQSWANGSRGSGSAASR
jgi:hypothetical protein